MILTRKKLKKERSIGSRADGLKFLNENKKPLQYQMGVMLEGIPGIITVDDLEQALVRGSLTPQISKKVYELFKAFSEENLSYFYSLASDWILEDLGWDFKEIERVGEGSPEAWADMMTQLTDTAVHNAVRVFDTDYRYRNIEPEEIAPLLHKALRLNAPQIIQVMNNYAAQREQLGRTKAKRAAQRLINYKTKDRAETLAIDALGNAYMTEERIIVDQAINLGYMSPLSMKQWDTAKDGHVCGICKALEAIGMIPVNEDFVYGELRLSGMSGAHSRCRCAVRYIDRELIEAGIY